MSEKGNRLVNFLNFLTNSSEYTTTETVIEHKIDRNRNIKFLFKGFRIETVNCIFEGTDTRRFR